MATQKQQLESTIRTALAQHEPSPTPVSTGQGPLAGRKKDAQAFLLKVERVRTDQDQVRRMQKNVNDPDIQQLAASIKQYGLQNPIDIRWIEADDIYELVAGERRFVATTKLLGWTEVPVRVIDATDEQIIWLQLHENIHRADLHPLDLAHAIHRLIQSGTSIETIANKLCKSTTYVQKALTIAKGLSADARALLKSTTKATSIESVYEVAQMPTPEQKPLLKRIVEKGISRTELRKLTATAKQKNQVIRKAKGGRPTTAKPHRTVLKTSDGITVTVQFRKARATTAEIAEALRAALAQLNGLSYPANSGSSLR